MLCTMSSVLDSGSGINPMSNDTILYTSTPTISLVTIYGIALLVLIIIAIVSMIINILYQRQQVKNERYYTFSSRLTIELHDNSIMKGSMSDLPSEQLRQSSGEGKIENVELVWTQEEPSCSLSHYSTAIQDDVAIEKHTNTPPNIPSAEDVEATETPVNEIEVGKDPQQNTTIYDDECINNASTVCKKKVSVKNIPTQQKQEQFSFEDGTALHDYPASVDLEIVGRDGASQKANIIGYCDIYSSQILQTVPHDQIINSTSVEGYGKSKHALSHESSKKHFDLPKSTETSTLDAMDLVIPQIIVEEPGRHGGEMSSASLKEAQDLLTKSLSDLLEMTDAMTVDDDYDDKTNDETEKIIENEEEGNSEGDDDINQHHNNTQLQDNTSTTVTITTTHLTQHLPFSSSTPSDNEAVGHSTPVSARASVGGSDINLAELLDPNELSDLDPEIQRTLMGSNEFSELQISHV